MTMSFPKMVQTLRDQGGRARREAWGDDEWLELGPVPWNGEQEALLHIRPSTGHTRRGGNTICTIFLPYALEVRANDWRIALTDKDASS